MFRVLRINRYPLTRNFNNKFILHVGRFQISRNSPTTIETNKILLNVGEYALTRKIPDELKENEYRLKKIDIFLAFMMYGFTKSIIYGIYDYMYKKEEKKDEPSEIVYNGQPFGPSNI